MKILAAGIVFYMFLSEFSYSKQAKFMAAFAYGMNGYLLVWGQHYQFGMVTVYFPLMLLFAEKYIRGKKGKTFFCVVVFLSGIYSLKKADGKSSVVNIEWREKLNTICDMLVALRKRLKIAKDTGAYSLYGEDDVMYCFYDRDLAIWFDSTREEILKILSSICEEIGIHGLGFPRKRYEW